MYLPILHLPKVELRCELQGKLHDVTGPSDRNDYFYRISYYKRINEMRKNLIGKVPLVIISLVKISPTDTKIYGRAKRSTP